MKQVLFLTHAVHFYRKPFHDRVRAQLAAHGVNYVVAQGDPRQHDLTKNDTIVLDWAIARATRMLRIGRGEAMWQPFLREALKADLVVLPQENKYLLNYLLQVARPLLRGRLALWGHGRNFQARDPNGRAERFKRFWATRAHWWFGYTEETRRHLVSLGFPAQRITVFNNSVDTREMREQSAAVGEDALAGLRARMGVSGGHVGVFVGGIYPDKRMDFLADAADRIRARIPDFELIVVGGGSGLQAVRDMAASRPWMHVTGPKFGAEKVELMKLGHVFMMPGLMGLAILDAGVVGLPIATTAFPWHSPEIAYLEPGVSGIRVEDWEKPQAYADAVADLLADPARLRQMSLAARAMADRYTIEAMADNFADGVLKALAA